MFRPRARWLWLVAFVLTVLATRFTEAASPTTASPTTASPKAARWPKELAEWVDWVQATEPSPRDCRNVNNGVTICVWPSAMSLDVSAKGARFVLDVSVFGRPEDEQTERIELPGDDKMWPQDVMIDGKRRAVLEDGESPGIDLDEGRHTVTGFIPWHEVPDSLRIPGRVGLIRLNFEGKLVPSPVRDPGWLSFSALKAASEAPDREPEETSEGLPGTESVDKETLEVSRHLIDGVPLRIVTRIDLHIAGKERELVLPDPMLEGSKLLQISAPVPVSLGEQGSVVLQVRPGTFALELVGVLARSPTRLHPPTHPAPWPEHEFWVWQASAAGTPSLGQVSLSGAQAVDRAHTHAPGEWQGATYRLDTGAALAFDVIQRGISETTPHKLLLRRDMRIDLDGNGWTLVDDIHGKVTKAIRLNLRHEDGVLGSVVSSRTPQVLTVTDDAHAGVEVRGPEVDLRATWRLEGATSTLPLGGWSEDFDGVRLAFMLPRGWDVLHAEGPGALAPTWLGSWRPLELLALLGVALWVARSVSPYAGLAALVGLGLAYTQDDDGYLILLALVAALAGAVPLLRRPLGRARSALRLAWTSIAFVVGAWLLASVPAGVAAVWRDGDSGLAHAPASEPSEAPSREDDGVDVVQPYGDGGLGLRAATPEEEPPGSSMWGPVSFDGKGYGRGRGAGFGGRGNRVPQVRIAEPVVDGNFDPDVVRATVRSHINEVRQCYSEGLVRVPSLDGRVRVRFEIANTGAVSSPTVLESSLSDATVGGCITSAFRRWTFPKPKGASKIIVTLAFHLSNGGGGSSSSATAPSPDGQTPNDEVSLPEPKIAAVPQTGEGVPQWSGPRWRLVVDRAVKRDESVTLWLVTPAMSRVISIARGLALMFLVFMLVRAGWLARPSRGASLIAGLALFLIARPAEAAPSDKLLEQLAERVNAERPLAPTPECGSDCALVNRLEVAVARDELTLRAEVHLAGPGVWVVPGSVDTWIPRSIQIDGKPAQAMAMYEEHLVLHLSQGLHRVELRGPLPRSGGEDFNLGLTGAPKHVVVVAAEGWTVDGIDEDDLAQSLRLTRHGTKTPDPLATSEAVPAAPSQDLPPWFAVERRLEIGPRWVVETQVTRLSHGPSPTKLHVPLLPGEKLLDTRDEVDDPQATITLRTPGESITWKSVLEPSDAISLEAPTDKNWTETWSIRCTGAWQCSDEGVPATADRGDTRIFHPWPGEKLRLTLIEPHPADGPLLTVDKANLELKLGETGTEARLTMKVRAATVIERTFTLPADAHVDSVTVNGMPVPTAKDATVLRLTFQPGSHDVSIAFKRDDGAAAVVRVPVVELGGRAVDARVTLTYSDEPNRVVVWASGEGVGPTVWLWPYFGVLALLALALARLVKSPLHASTWFTLSLGFSMLTLPLIGLWFVLVAWRERNTARLARPMHYNATQLALGLATLLVAALMLSTARELLTSPASPLLLAEGRPPNPLSWYVDRADTSTPAATVITVSTSLWRAAWAAWVVWLAWRSIAWGKWAWRVASADGWLHKGPAAQREGALQVEAQPPGEPSSEASGEGSPHDA